MSIKNHRFGRETTSQASVVPSHIVKIGWDRRYIPGVTFKPSKPGAEKHKHPARLSGFVLCRDSKNEGGTYKIAYDCMEKLGVAKDAVHAGLAAGLRGTQLPVSLPILLLADAVRVGPRWEFPHLKDSYMCRDRAGMPWCTGDGVEAKRKSDKVPGVLDRVSCDPIGSLQTQPASEGGLGHTPCEYSVNRVCGVTCSFIFAVIFRDPQTGRWCPITDSANSRWIVKTGSEWGAIAIKGELERAADVLNGRIAYLPGWLNVTVRERKAAGKDGNMQTGLVPTLSLVLDEQAIQDRLAQLSGARTIAAPVVEASHQIESAPAPLALPAPPAQPFGNPEQLAQLSGDSGDSGEFSDDGEGFTDSGDLGDVGQEPNPFGDDTQDATYTPAPPAAAPHPPPVRQPAPAAPPAPPRATSQTTIGGEDEPAPGNQTATIRVRYVDEKVNKRGAWLSIKDYNDVYWSAGMEADAFAKPGVWLTVEYKTNGNYRNITAGRLATAAEIEAAK